MKKNLFTMLALCAFTVSIYAQTPKVKIGAKAGVNFADISGISNTNQDLPGGSFTSATKEMKTGFNAGVLTEFFLSKKFSIQPEILYSTQGYKIKEVSNLVGNDTVNVTKTITHNIDYVNVPIMVKFYIVEGLNVHLGPQIGFLMRDQTETKTSKITTKDGAKEVHNIPDIIDEPYESKYKLSNFGLNFGLGYSTPEGLFIDARYNLGLSNILKDESTDGKTSYKHRVIQISVGFKF